MECFRKHARRDPGHKNGSFAMVLALAVLVLFCYACQAPESKIVVSVSGDQWQINGEPILAGTVAEGRLVNVRMVNAVFEDDRASAAEHLPDGFDPDENTSRFIASIPDYCDQGVRAFTVSLQGGMPGYEGAVNTAFNADGSLKPKYLKRVENVIRAADEHGAVIILSCFYQRQRSNEFALGGKQAIFDAVKNVAEWIQHEEFSNVVLEISNEFSHGGYKGWNDGEWLRSVEGQVELIRHAKEITPDLLVSTSGMGSGLIPEEIAAAADFIILHFNRTPLNLIPERIAQARRFGKPVICNEDDKTGQMGAEAARLSISAGAGWGFMHLEKNQAVPFEFDGARDDSVVYRMLKDLTTPGGTVDGLAEKAISVMITHPVDGDVFAAGEAVTIRAQLTGVENSDEIDVQFSAGEKIIGEASSPPWEYVWKDPPVGHYNVMAIVRDAKGLKVLQSGLADFEVRR